MRRLLLIAYSSFQLFGYGIDPHNEKQLAVLRHLDIPPSFLRDPYLSDIYLEKKRDAIMNGFTHSVENAEVFIPMISSLIAQSDLPSEFLFLALAESGLDTLSTSSRGAGGIWQFMEHTGRLHGLTINKYVDERRDHVKSTRAAITYLSQLHRQFGKWYLAIIAYNCGDGKLSSAIRRAKSDDLSVLANPQKAYIPYETRRYIRSIVALALLASDKVFLEQIHYDHLIGMAAENPVATVYLPEGEEIDRIAAVLEMPKKKLTLLNTHLRRGATPPNKSSYPVYIPADKLDMLRFKYRTKGLKGYFLMHKTSPGDSVGSLAKRYETTQSQIRDENMLSEHDELKGNRFVRIPVKNHHKK